MSWQWLLVSLCWASSSVSEDACDFGIDIPWKQKMLKLEQVTRCLNATTMTAEILYHTISHVEHGVLDLYSFDSLAGASRESDQSITGGCNFSVHDVHVDLRKELGELKAKALNDLGLQSQAFEVLLQKENQRKDIPAYPIHSAIADMFRRLHDAHTIYVPPWVPSFVRAYIYVFEGAGGIDAGSRIRLKVTGVGAQPEVQILDVWGEPGDYIDEVFHNSKTYAPFEWIKNDANQRVGLYKSLGARVNSWLNEWGNGLFGLLHGGPLPEAADTLIFKMRNPDTGKVRNRSVGIYFLPQQLPTKLTLESLNDLINNNPRWDVVKGWLEAHVHADHDERQQRMETLTAQAMQLAEAPEQTNLYWLPWQEPVVVVDQEAREVKPSEKQERLELLATKRRLDNSDEPELIATYPDRRGHAPEMFVYHLPKSSTAILRVTSFMPPAVDMANPAGFIGAIIRMYKKAVDTRAARLILDLTDNGGGMVDAANILIQLIAPRLSTKEKLCNPYVARLEPFWRDWLESFGGKWDKIARAAAEKSPEDLVEKLQQLMNLRMMIDSLRVSLPLNREKLESLWREVLGTSDPAGKKKLIIDHLESRDIFVNSILLGNDADSGWYPFTGDVNDMKGRPFQPQTKPYFTSSQHKWGSRMSNYSDKFQLACDLAFNRQLDFAFWWQESGSMTGAKHQWNELAVLTNGLCGSACSMTATKLQMAEGATVFTFGGVPGEKMDVSAFAGGNVEQYKVFWPTVLTAALIGDILHGSGTKMHKRLQESVKAGDLASTLLLPLPTPATMTFNFNMIFEPTLGDKALPREFYLIPAHKNYDRWLVTAADPWSPLSGRTTAPDLLELFKVIAEEDWKAVRQGAGGFDSCGDGPPTSPYRGQWDWGVVVYPVAALLCLLCLGFCRFCCLCCCPCCCRKSSLTSEFAARSPPVEPGVQMRTLEVQP